MNKLEDPAVRTAASDSRPKLDVGRAVKGLKRDATKTIGQLDRWADYWQRRDRAGSVVLQAYALSATLVMGVNLVMKQQVTSVGGWIPFCLAATVLTALATFFSNRQASEGPRERRDRCLELLSLFRQHQRKLDRSDWSEAKLARFDREFKKAETGAALYRCRPPAFGSNCWWWVALGVVLVAYFAFEVAYAAGRWGQFTAALRGE